MTDLRTSFPTLEDATTQVGAPLHKVLEGTAAAAKNASAALVAKDPSGNLIYLRTDAAGNLAVTTEGAANCKKARGELAAGQATTPALVTGANIPLTVSKGYKEIGFLVSCRRDALFQIIWNDNGAETILGEIVVGSGAFTVPGELHCLSFTAGATGTQELKIKAMNFEALSSLRASLTVEEV